MGMGKTTVSSMFKKNGIKVWNADIEVHKLYENGNEGYKNIISVYPQLIYTTYPIANQSRSTTQPRANTRLTLQRKRKRKGISIMPASSCPASSSLLLDDHRKVSPTTTTFRRRRRRGVFQRRNNDASRVVLVVSPKAAAAETTIIIK